MARREVFMVESADAAVALREQRVAALSATSEAIPAYLERLYLAIATYSRGDELAAVRAAVRKAVEALENDSAEKKAAFDFRNHDHYYGALWGLSLSMLFGDPSPEFLHRGVGQDSVYDRLLVLTGALVSPVHTLVRPHPYAFLRSAMDQPKESTQAIGEYLRNWYAAMSQTHWHDTHMQHDPMFFGYWAFELAAVVKALHITDTAFSDNIFYPRDLVHQRMFRTWLDGTEGDNERQFHGATHLQQQLEEAKRVLMSFFEGTTQGTTAQTVGDSMKMLSGLLGLTPDALKENPEMLRMGLLQVVRAILTVSKEALQVTGGQGNPNNQKVVEAFREIQEKIGGKGADMEAATKLLSEYVDVEGAEADLQSRVAEARSRLEAVNQAFSGLVTDQSIGLEGLFSGMDRLTKEFSAQLGITSPKPYDAYESTSKDVGKALDEANKKNMIQEDFDWSSLWKKK